MGEVAGTKKPRVGETAQAWRHIAELTANGTLEPIVPIIDPKNRFGISYRRLDVKAGVTSPDEVLRQINQALTSS